MNISLEFDIITLQNKISKKVQRSGKGKGKEQERIFPKNLYLFKKNLACNKPYFHCDGTDRNKVLYPVTALCIRQSRPENVSSGFFTKFCLHIYRRTWCGNLGGLSFKNKKLKGKDSIASPFNFARFQLLLNKKFFTLLAIFFINIKYPSDSS